MGIMLYLFFIIANLQNLLLGVAIASIVLLLVYICISLCLWGDAADSVKRSYNTDTSKAKCKIYGKYCKTKLISNIRKYSIIIFIMFLMFACIPEAKQMAIIFVVAKIERADFTKQVGKVPAKTMKILNKMLDEYLDDFGDILDEGTEVIKETSNAIKESAEVIKEVSKKVKEVDVSKVVEEVSVDKISEKVKG